MEKTEEPVDEIKERKMNAIRDCMFSLACIDNNKPVGPAKHFRMLEIHLNLQEITDNAPGKEELWKKLRSLVNLELLEEKDEEEKEDRDQAFEKYLEEAECFKLPDEMTEGVEDKADEPKPEEEVSEKPAKPIKDYTRNRKTKPKEEEEVDEESDGKESAPDSDEDTPLKPPKTGRRSQAVKKSAPAKKPPPKRRNRSMREAVEKEASPASTSSKKTDDEAPVTTRKSNLGKRSLRSRGDEDGYGSSPTHTPPPTTRSRRI